MLLRCQISKYTNLDAERDIQIPAIKRSLNKLPQSIDTGDPMRQPSSWRISINNAEGWMEFEIDDSVISNLTLAERQSIKDFISQLPDFIKWI